MPKSVLMEHPDFPTVRVWAQNTQGDPVVKNALSAYDSSRKWSIFFGALAGATIAAYVCTSVFVAPNLATHTWTVIGVGAIVPGTGLVLFAVSTSRAVKHNKELHFLLVGLKDYSLLQLVTANLFYNEDLSDLERKNYVLGIMSDDMPIFLKYIDDHILSAKLPAVTEEFAKVLEERLSNLADYIQARGDWEEQLENAALKDEFFKSLQEYRMPIEESKSEDD